MGSRVTLHTRRPEPIDFTFDGATLPAYPGETLAAALIANNISGFRRDLHGRLRGPYCNMGTCFECMLEVRTGDSWRAVRACLTPVAAGMTARSRSSIDAAGRSRR
ncbi:MAG TPA: (2Fe-2S)-binding protein [Steroidobacteraceae bacterium]|jgi:sarcosine oxidase subunit alpha|nr:(2Fe-2S)-binding protein [Steroidobacteraceae bacterium]